MKKIVLFLLAIGVFCPEIYAQPGRNPVNIHRKDTAGIYAGLQAEFDNFIIPQIREEIHLLDGFITTKWEMRFFERGLSKIDDPPAREKIRKGLAEMTEKIGEINRLCKKIPHDLEVLKKNEARCLAMAEEGQFTSRAALLQYRNEKTRPFEKGFQLDLKNLKKNLKGLVLLIRAYLQDTRYIEEPILSVLLSDYITEIKKAERELDSLLSRLQELEVSISRLQDRIGRLNSENGRLAEEKKEVTDELGNVQLQLDSKIQQLVAAREDYEKEKEEINRKFRQTEKYYQDSLFILENKISTANKKLEDDSLSLAAIDELLIEAEKKLEAKSEELKEKEKEVKRERLNNEINESRSRYQRNLLILALGALTLFLFNNFFWARSLKMKNEQLKKKKKLLEFYLRELPHRVKNNLQDIIALLSLQADEIKDQAAKGALQDAQHRIYAVNLLHRHLYKENQMHLTTVNLKDYIHDLVGYLSEICNGNAARLEQQLHVQNLHVEIDKAVFIGLILNELIANCFEHALKGADKPKLMVGLFADQGRIHISVKDNGPGMPPQAFSANHQSFGLSLVDKLVHEEKGTANFFNDNGACCEITLPVSAGIYLNAIE